MVLLTVFYSSKSMDKLSGRINPDFNIIARGTLALPLDLDYDENRHIVPKNYKKQDIPYGKHSY